MAQTVFDDNDKDILDKTLKLRTRMLDVFARKADTELPTKPSEMLAIAQLAGSIDKTVIDRAKVRAEENNSQSQEKDRALFLDLLHHLHQSPKPVVAEAAISAMPAFTPRDSASVAAGELIRREDDIDVSQYT